MRYLICAENGVGAIVDVSPGLSSDDYADLQARFVSRFYPRAPVWAKYAEMIRLWPDQCHLGVYYDWGLAGPDGAWYTVFKLPGVSADRLREAKARIRHDGDVVRLNTVRISKLVEFDLGEGLGDVCS